MAFDLNSAERQSERKYGPVPTGSKVLLKMEYKAPKNSHPKNQLVAVSNTGLLMLWIEFTVQSGEYEGVHWRENWMLPEGMQTVSLTDGQKKACAISFGKMRAIVEAARGINPRDTSAAANSKRKLGSVMDLNGLEFPASLGLDKGREGTDKNGNRKTYFNNTVSFVITPDKREYAALMDGGEIINPNGITKRDDGPAEYQPSSRAYDDPFAAPSMELNDAIPSEQPPMDEECPF